MRNNLTTSVVIIFLFPLSIFIFTNLALRKLPSIGLYDIDFDVWIYPSMIYLVAGLCILPSIFRDVFDLRVHKKVLSYLSLSPHSKRYMILSFSIVSIVESLIFGFVSIILFSALILFLLFGSGLIISPSFYPSSLKNLLSVLPLAMAIKAMQSYLFSGFINWIFTVIPFLTSLLLLSLNSILIRKKLRQ